MRILTLSLMFTFLSPFLMCQTEAAVAVADKDSSSSISDLVPSEPIKIKLLAPATVSKKHTRTRQNSRFLRTFPPVELLNLARQSAMNNDIDPVMDYNYNYNQNQNYNRNYNRNNNNYFNYNDKMGMGMGMGSSYSNRRNPVAGFGNPHPNKARIEAGNSPIFYIKLPPVPYVFMPGVGYVSPHPYSNSPSMPMSMSAAPAMMPGLGSFLSGMSNGQENSMEQQNPVISLPLKFLSNGRPHQIESPKRKKRPGPGNKENSSESKGASLISGGKYSFNGRPTAVFVVRSPAANSNKF